MLNSEVGGTIAIGLASISTTLDIIGFTFHHKLERDAFDWAFTSVARRIFRE